MIQITSYKITEEPYYLDIKKHHIMGLHPTMIRLNYDPFPNAKPDDIVRSEIAGRRYVLTAKVDTTGDRIQIGMAIEVENHKFAFKEISGQMDTTIRDIVADEHVLEFQPVEIIENYRKLLASNPKQNSNSRDEDDQKWMMAQFDHFILPLLTSHNFEATTKTFLHLIMQCDMQNIERKTSLDSFKRRLEKLAHGNPEANDPNNPLRAAISFIEHMQSRLNPKTVVD